MFRLKTTRRNAKRTSSPIRPAPAPALAPAPVPASDPALQAPSPSTDQPTETNIVVKEQTGNTQNDNTLEKQMVNFFEAESAAVSLSKPWLRLERGLRLQKYRAFAEAYPGLNTEEKESLYKTLMKANDAKLLNTKQHVQYENGVIQAVRGLKVIKTGDPSVSATFKIDTMRSTKKHQED